MSAKLSPHKYRVRNFINIITEAQRPEFLYHGTWRGNVDAILAEGISAPSYWGTLEMATDYKNQYAGEGILIRVPVSSFDEDGLEANEAVIASLTAAGEYIDGEVTPPETWLESLEELGSVVYHYTLRIDADDIIDE